MTNEFKKNPNKRLIAVAIILSAVAIIASISIFNTRKAFNNSQNKPEGRFSASLQIPEIPNSEKSSSTSATGTPPKQLPASTQRDEPASQPIPSQTTATPTLKTFFVEADEKRATPDTISIKRDEKFQLIIHVPTEGMPNGGIEFQGIAGGSGYLGPIKPGETKTFTITPHRSYIYAPWSPNRAIRFPYSLRIVIY